MNTATKKIDPTKPVQTRDGREAGIDHTDGVGGYQLLGWHRCKSGDKYQTRWNEYGCNIGINARDLVNIPEYPPLPEAEGGRLEYRGKGWDNGGKECRYATCSSNGDWHLNFYGDIPNGSSCHYAEFIPDEPTTVRGWLETLPDGYRERALGHLRVSDAEVRARDLHYAIVRAFSWEDTPEGDDFWIEVARGNRPPLPTEPKLVPYTLETFPMWAIWARAMDSKVRNLTSSVTFNGIHRANGNFLDWERLLSNYEIAGVDGIWHPAGQEVEA